MKLKPLKVKKIMEMNVVLGEPFTIGETGEGVLEITPITGGKFKGENPDGEFFEGEIMNYGGDWGVAHGETANNLNNRYIMKTTDGALIAAESYGKVEITLDDMIAAYEGNDIDPESYYMREFVKFKTSSPEYNWLNNTLTVVKGMIVDGGVYSEVYAI